MITKLLTAMRYVYYTLFFLIPFLLTPVNYELFEFNKMLFVYVAASVIGTLWAFRMTIEKRFIFRSTVLDIPIALFLIAHLISTVYSIDPYLSVWGYYGRFNGGLVSLFSYLILYYGLVSNSSFGSDHSSFIKNCLFASLFSGFLVSLYAIAQHFGIDANLWVQDVQNRVFSTLGQPNWLAAYVAILLPIAFSFIVLALFKQNSMGETTVYKCGWFFAGVLCNAFIYQIPFGFYCILDYQCHISLWFILD